MKKPGSFDSRANGFSPSLNMQSAEWDNYDSVPQAESVPGETAQAILYAREMRIRIHFPHIYILPVHLLVMVLPPFLCSAISQVMSRLPVDRTITQYSYLVNRFSRNFYS